MSEDLRAAAAMYHKLGIPVIPFKLTKTEKGDYGKQNLSPWKKWETEPQTDEEFFALNWNGANAFGLVLGAQAGNGFYLSVVDYDCKGDSVSQEVKDKGREILKDFPITCMEETVNKGIHLVYWSRTKPKTIGTFHDTASLELLGEKKLCLMAPSLGYSKINDNSPTEIESIEQTFNSVMKKHGLIKEEAQSRQSVQAKSGTNKIRPCIVEALKLQLTGPTGHRMRLAIAAEYKRHGFSDEEIMDLFRQQGDFDSSTCRAQISSANPEKTATCKSIRELGYCLPNCSIKERSSSSAGSSTCSECAFFKTPKCSRSNPKKNDAPCEEFYHKTEQKAKNTKKVLKDSGISASGYFEAIYNSGKPCFLVNSRGTFILLESVEVDEQEVFPKEARNVPYEPYGFSQEPTPPMEVLYNEVRAVFEDYIDVQDPWKDVMAACVLLSYQQHKLQTVPYVLVYGDNESGKSTVLQIFKTLCYRPLYGVTIPAADIYGYLDDNDSTGVVLEDEIQGIHKDIDKVKIYKAGYKRGASVPRTLITQNDRIIKYYNVFSFKAIASEQLPQVKGFRERFLEIAMTEGYPAKEWSDVKPEDLEHLREVRNKLLKWRMQTREQELPDVELSIKGRLKELWKPLLQITKGLVVYDNLFNFVENQQKERLNIKQDTLEGKIVKVVISILNEIKDNSASTSFQTIWSRLKEELDGKIDEKKPNVMDTSEFFQVTKNKVGYRLREILGGRTKVLREKDAYGNWVSVKAYEFDLDKARRIAKKYGFELVTKLSTLLSSEGMRAAENGLRASESMGKTLKNGENNNENSPVTPQELGKLNNSVTTVQTEVSEQTEVKTEDVGPSSKGSIVQTAYFRRLAPNEPHSCDGEWNGGACPHEAKYLIGDQNYYCEDHFQASKAACERNSYSVIETKPEDKPKEEPKNCNRCINNGTDCCSLCYDFSCFQDFQTKLPSAAAHEEAL